ncbi:MAG: ATP-binding cassette domain-containing protein, partial [Chloroflexi bacterium]|nr:ATP-binding cassette domain-containing protein [Chloroflexota bacterium]
MTERQALIEIRDLVKYFPVREGFFQRTIKQVRAVDRVNLTIQAGETLGLVGESGCGKSTLGRVILRLIEPTSGEVLFEGVELNRLDAAALRRQRRKMQIVFQDPFGSLDPRMTIGQSIGQGLRAHGVKSASERDALVGEVLRRVGLSEWHRNRFPHEFSGGQRQRIGIARA